MLLPRFARPLRVLPAALGLSLLTALAGQPARAALTLTPAGTAANFSLSTFAFGFPTNGSVGPLGIAFPSSGGVLVADYAGQVLTFPSDTDGQNAAATPTTQNYGGGNAVDLAQVGGSIYMTRQSIGDLVQINNNGTFNQVIATGMSSATGLVTDPANGHLFVSTPGAGPIYDVDPIAKTKTLFVGANFDGLTISPDGKTLYGANPATGQIIGYDITTKLPIFTSAVIGGGIDGSALGSGSLAGNLFVNTNSGQVYEVNLTAPTTPILIASGGSRGDFVTVDPNGSLLLTQTDTVVRLTPPTGGTFGPSPGPTTGPSTLTPESSGLANAGGALLALALAGLVTAIKKKRAKASA